MNIESTNKCHTKNKSLQISRLICIEYYITININTIFFTCILNAINKVSPKGKHTCACVNRTRLFLLCVSGNCMAAAALATADAALSALDDNPDI